MDDFEDDEQRWEHNLSEFSDEDAKSFFKKGKRKKTQREQRLKKLESVKAEKMIKFK